MSTQTITVPDIGGADSVEVIEICIAVGDQVAEEDSLIVLESDKASMEVPSPMAGKVVSISVAEGDNVAEGSAILELETAGAAAAPVAEAAPVPEQPAEPVQAEPSTEAAAVTAPAAVETIVVPDIGGADAVDVIEVCVAAGDQVEEGDSLIVLESDKASMEVPAPKAGKVVAVAIKEGDKANQGTVILELAVQGGTAAASAEKSAPVEQSVAEEKPQSPAPSTAAPAAQAPASPATRSGHLYAGPAVRRLARELGVDLEKVAGTGPKGRLQKEDVQNYVKQALAGGATATGGSGVPPIPEIDFAQFGEIDIQPMTKLHRVTAQNMQRAWLNVPHVTQFDEADITDLEDFRASLKKEAEARGVKITPLPFLLKACAAALKSHQSFNASLHADGERIVYKQYVHIGMAVATPAGLVVPVIRDVDKKSIWELAAESSELAHKAKDRKLKPIDMQGACFTVSSLGSIGGTGFTPIVNAPEVAILGVSKLAVKPVWDGNAFIPRKMLPLSLSYDHRAINGADGGAFFTDLTAILSDLRRLVL